MGRTNQGGSILGFLVLGGVMILLLVGGVYTVRHSFTSSSASEGLIAHQDENAPQENESSERSSEDDQSKPEETPEKESAAPTPEEDKGVADEDAPHQPATPEPSTESTEESHEAPSDLPTTGPADVLLEGLMVSGLVAVIGIYRRSRQLEASL